MPRGISGEKSGASVVRGIYRLGCANREDATTDYTWMCRRYLPSDCGARRRFGIAGNDVILGPVTSAKRNEPDDDRQYSTASDFEPPLIPGLAA